MLLTEISECKEEPALEALKNEFFLFHKSLVKYLKNIILKWRKTVRVTKPRMGRSKEKMGMRKSNGKKNNWEKRNKNYIYGTGRIEERIYKTTDRTMQRE